MANNDLILTSYQLSILPCITLIFWSLFLIIFRIDGSGRWSEDIHSFILNSRGHLNITWFVFNETKELCSCFTKDFNECDRTQMKGEKHYLCTYPIKYGDGLITYCNKSNYDVDSLSYDDDYISLYVIKPTNNCQPYGEPSRLVRQKLQLPCPFCYE
ncbi:unnamed protein product [Schistosoma spindalis]|nr:unnamed protein product [Schistosoma spindale]